MNLNLDKILQIVKEFFIGESLVLHFRHSLRRPSLRMQPGTPSSGGGGGSRRSRKEGLTWSKREKVGHTFVVAFRKNKRSQAAREIVFIVLPRTTR